MRVLLIPITVLAFANPALAQNRAEDAAVAAELLNSPVVQDHVADRLTDAVAAMLDLRVGGIERAIDPTSRARRDETLRDHLDRDDPDFEARLHSRTRRAVGAAGVVSSEMAAMLPELQARLANIKHRLRNPDAGYPHADARPRADLPPADAPEDEGEDFGGDWDD